MLLGRDTENISNLHRDRSSSFHIGQIEDDYETEPLISTQQFFKRIRGRKGAYPPVKKGVVARSPGSMSKAKTQADKTPVYACAQVNELTTIDTKSNTFTVRLSLMLILDIDIAKTTMRLQEEYEECLSDPAKDTLKGDRQRKVQQWAEIIENSLEDGTPYTIEDEEYELFEEEIEWPESLELFNKITEDQTEEPKFVILRNHPANASKLEDVMKATIFIEFMEGLYECKEYQELEFFPFDLQDLTLDFQLTTRTDIDRFDFRLHTVEFYRPCLQMAEWVLYPPESDRKGTAKTSVRLRATRKSQYYITNIVGMMCILNLMCIAAFGVEVPDIADRLSVTMTMMLTAVAFKFIVGDQLPKVSYNTYLDFYLLYTMFFMFLVSIYFCAGPHLWKAWFSLDDIGGDPGEPVVTDVKNADKIICWIFASIFVLFTGYWFWCAYWIVKEIQEELPPPILLQDGVEYISYRWQQVPFKGFENPQSEREARGKAGRNMPDPENIDRLLSFSTREVVDVSSQNDDLISEISMDEKLQDSDMAGMEKINDRTLSVQEPDTGGGVSPSTYEIEVGTLPAGFNDNKVVQMQPYSSGASSKRGPESPARSPPADIDETVPLNS